jgi:hypothetical protein
MRTTQNVQTVKEKAQNCGDFVDSIGGLSRLRDSVAVLSV